LLDEPVAGLDPNAAAEMYGVIKDLNNSGITIIMISHDIAASVRDASHILHIGARSSLFYGETAEFLKSSHSWALAMSGGHLNDSDF
jgi:zinc transport system ATP-binding protein